MGKVVVSLSVSLDGMIAGPEGDLSWHRVDEELHAHFNEQLRAMSWFLNGRVMHELMAEFWPTADADPASPPAIVEFAGIWRDMPKVVYSRTLERADWNATVVREVVPAEVEAMKQAARGDLALGGAEIAEVFRRRGLVDEYRLYVHPVVLGAGKPLFGAASGRTDFRLAETRAFGSGVLLQRYERS